VLKLFHLSHIDLDGYSCQLVTRHFFDEVHYYNANYGPEVTARLEEIESDIQSLHGGEPIMLLITDVNITEDECQRVNKMRERFLFLNIKLKVQLLDHHITGKRQADNHDWYHLDISKSATRLTYDFCVNHFKKELETPMQRYVQAVNAYDLWLQDDEGFEFGKVLNRVVVDSKEISKMMFRYEHVENKHALLLETLQFIEPYDHIALDDTVFKNKKEFFAKGRDYNTIDNLVASYVIDLLNKKRESMTIVYRGHKGVLTFQGGNTSVLGNAFLTANPEYAFYMDVNPSGNVSLRANGQLDVSQMAIRLYRGGGHPNASGGRMGSLRDAYVYAKLRTLVQNYIDEKCDE